MGPVAPPRSTSRWGGHRLRGGYHASCHSAKRARAVLRRSPGGSGLPGGWGLAHSTRTWCLSASGGGSAINLGESPDLNPGFHGVQASPETVGTRGRTGRRRAIRFTEAHLCLSHLPPTPAHSLARDSAVADYRSESHLCKPHHRDYLLATMTCSMSS